MPDVAGRMKWRLVVGGVLAVSVAAPSSAVQTASTVQQAPTLIASRISDRNIPVLGTLTFKEFADVSRLYEYSELNPVWTDAGGRLLPHARTALFMLRSAADDGLEPGACGADKLDALAARLQTAGPAAAEQAADFDVALSGGLLRYLRYLHLGRVDPRTLRFRVTAPPDDHDFAALLWLAIEDDRLVETAASLRPAPRPYGLLRGALARYRAVAATPALVPWRGSGRVVRPGDRLDDSDGLRRWLIALADLAPGDAVGPETARDTYDAPLVAAIQRFQGRHGLAADGVIGRATQAALAVPAARRARQIELALERLRWLPHPGDRAIVVNIPMFRLWSLDAGPGGRTAALDMGVIVGKALNTQTPVLDAVLTHVIFRPYWNVPRSILRNEVLPKLRRDPGYLRRNDMEIVRGAGDDARVVPLSADALAGLGQGTLRLRQRPGANNSLGLVKFVFPNASDVYLHGTPAVELFARPRRDFSHGCVRAERPVEMAEWVLASEPGWTRERILEAMHASSSRRVDLTRPIQVLLYYLTAMVTPADGSVHFVDDIYGHDGRLERALQAAR